MAGWPGRRADLGGLWLSWAGCFWLACWVDGWAWPRAHFLHILGWLAWAAARNQESNPLCSCWMPALSLYVFLLHYVGHCGLMFLLDASQLTGFFFSITLVGVVLCSCWMLAWPLDAFFLNHSVVVVSCPCWMKACSLDDFC